MISSKTKLSDRTSSFNRIAYVVYVLLGMYFLIIKNDLADAMSILGIGLIFDPFKQEVSWNNRPFYQKLILITHLSIVFVLLGIMAFHFFQN